jgi:hypothetical protein
MFSYVVIQRVKQGDSEIRQIWCPFKPNTYKEILTACFTVCVGEDLRCTDELVGKIYETVDGNTELGNYSDIACVGIEFVLLCPLIRGK